MPWGERASWRRLHKGVGFWKLWWRADTNSCGVGLVDQPQTCPGWRLLGGGGAGVCEPRLLASFGKNGQLGDSTAQGYLPRSCKDCSHLQL